MNVMRLWHSPIFPVLQYLVEQDIGRTISTVAIQCLLDKLQLKKVIILIIIR